jgi:broad specificity phosphatase PhoE
MPTLYFIRHGEADHNVGAKIYGDAAYDMPCYWNPSLTEKGIAQARKLQTIIDLHDKYIIVSPLQRALETAYEGFPGATFQIDDRVTEFNPAWRCNRRIDLATLRDEWPGHQIECSSSTPTAEETKDELLARARKFIDYVRERGDDLVVITHFDFMSAVFAVLGIDAGNVAMVLGQTTFIDNTYAGKTNEWSLNSRTIYQALAIYSKRYDCKRAKILCDKMDSYIPTFEEILHHCCVHKNDRDLIEKALKKGIDEFSINCNDEWEYNDAYDEFVLGAFYKIHHCRPYVIEI